MTADDINSAIAVPRSRVFVTVDGMFVVHWEENRVQDLLSGRYLPFTEKQFDAPVTDWELQQLRSRGVVESFDESFVCLQRVPEWEKAQTQRSYYLYTRIPKQRIREIEHQLSAVGLSERFAVRVREQFLMIRGEKGAAFVDEEAADAALRELAAALPDLFSESVVAFVDVIE
jgi:hypothetical protein